MFASSWIPLFNNMSFVLSAATLIATTLTLFIVSHDNHASGDRIFSDTTNSTGITSGGFAIILAASDAVYAFLGSDCGAHMCEEIPMSTKNAPEIFLVPLVVGLLIAPLFCVYMVYAITDINAVVNTATGLPLCSRYTTRALAPFPLPSIQEQTPIKGGVFLLQIYGAMFIGSSVAFSSMVSATIVFLQTSCVIPQAIIIYCGRQRVLPPRYFDLGRMSYVLVVSVGLMLFVMGTWLVSKRSIFKGLIST
ncbi:hypothetical protein GQ53DRAFT_806598 [Thozetella sp. PMI_491]|nr:hypothetical protein GQ53DRAFT_806598 [Thozetella sp. PMI_491]